MWSELIWFSSTSEAFPWKRVMTDDVRLGWAVWEFASLRARTGTKSVALKTPHSRLLINGGVRGVWKQRFQKDSLAPRSAPLHCKRLLAAACLTMSPLSACEEAGSA